MITLPYVTTASFKAHPTFLDLLNLRSGDPSLSNQTAELNNILLMASSMADNYCELGAEGSLSAHTRVENKRMRPDRFGRLLWHPDHTPFVSLLSVAYGVTMSGMTTVTNPATFAEDNRQIVVDIQSGNAQWSGRLQFGLPTGELYTTWTYLCGWANTVLAAPAITGAISVVVSDATGITAGSTLRIWDPGKEEPVTVASSYTSGTTIPLVSPLRTWHDPTPSDVGISGLPPSAHLAVINFACFLLQRPDSEFEDTYPSTSVRPNTRVGSAHGSGFASVAQGLLEPFRRVI